MIDVIRQIYSTPPVKYLLLLVLANVILGVLASLRRRDFRLTALGDWLWKRVTPLMIGYGVAAFLADSQPDLALLKEAAFVTLTGALLGYVLANLRDFGVTLPDSIAGKRSPPP